MVGDSSLPLGQSGGGQVAQTPPQERAACCRLRGLWVPGSWWSAGHGQTSPGSRPLPPWGLGDFPQRPPGVAWDASSTAASHFAVQCLQRPGAALVGCLPRSSGPGRTVQLLAIARQSEPRESSGPRLLPHPPRAGSAPQAATADSKGWRWEGGEEGMEGHNCSKFVQKVGGGPRVGGRDAAGSS